MSVIKDNVQPLFCKDNSLKHLVATLILMLFFNAQLSAMPIDIAEKDSLHSVENVDTVSNVTPRKSFAKRFLGTLGKFVRNFSEVDTNYIEPQSYNYTLMLQNTNTYELYRITSENGNYFTFSPLPSIKLGPYFGWRWAFLGYTFDLKHISNGNKKKEFDLSIYSSQIGIDLFYRKTGTDYKISHIGFSDAADVDTRPLRGYDYDGINVGIKGFNLYYIFNHKRFSYPAAFSQSTIQRRSCGSALCGIGYTKHSLSIDWDKLYGIVGDVLGPDISGRYMDSNLKYQKLQYTDLALSGGYAYNWAFAHNWLAAASLSLALAYKSSSSDSNNSFITFKDFSFHNFNIDGLGRFGVVYNNMKWYVGTSAIIHAYNYHKSRFYTNSLFGSVNIYIGFNFSKRKK